MFDPSSFDKAKAYLDLQLTRTPESRRPVGACGPFVTISRASGSGGSTLAAALAAHLGGGATPEAPQWTVFDRNLVEQVLADQQLSTRLARFLPEDRISEVSASVGEIVGLHPSLWTLVHRTNEAMRRFARLGHAILVGRGANFATAGCDRGLHVRLIGSADHRARKMARALGLSYEEALAHNRRTDAARRDYVRSLFDREIDDPLHYHLVINTDFVETPVAVAMIAAALREHGWI